MSENLLRFGWVVVLSWMQFGCAAGQVMEGRHFDLQASEDSEKGVFNVTLISHAKRDLCLDVDNWPNSAGALSHNSPTYVSVDGKTFPHTGNANFGYCPGGCEIKIGPGEIIEGFVAFSEFPADAFKERDASRTLHFFPHPYFCTRRQ